MKMVSQDGPFFNPTVLNEMGASIAHGSKTVTNTNVAFKIAKQFALIENASARKNEITALEKSLEKVEGVVKEDEVPAFTDSMNGETRAVELCGLACWRSR